MTVDDSSNRQLQDCFTAKPQSLSTVSVCCCLEILSLTSNGKRVDQIDDALRPRWLIIDDENFHIVCMLDPTALPALEQVNHSSAAIAQKQKLATSLHLPSSAPIELEVVAFQHVVYQLDLGPQQEAAWLREIGRAHV